MKQLTFKIRGIRPMIMHNGRLADPLNSYARGLAEVSGKRGKTEADFERMSEFEFDGGLYWSEDLGVYLPSDNLEAAFVKGSNYVKRGLGKTVMAGLFVEADYGCQVKLDGKPLKNLEQLRGDEKFRIRKGVRVQSARVMRTRPMVPTGWTSVFTLTFDETLLNPAQVQSIVENTGAYVGLGDWRPKFGRFVVED